MTAGAVAGMMAGAVAGMTAGAVVIMITVNNCRIVELHDWGKYRHDTVERHR